MTELLYLSDGYLCEFTARVVGVVGGGVVLERTAFYPGGGQREEGQKVNLLPPSITQVRVVEIEGLDMQADGGTHVANTAEVGPLRIVDYKSKGRINERLVLGLEEIPVP